MTSLIGIVMGSFSQPMPIDTNAASLVWLLPLVAAIAIVYKATKVREIQIRPFAKELVFIIVAALILYVVAWVITEQLPRIGG